MADIQPTDATLLPIEGGGTFPVTRAMIEAGRAAALAYGHPGIEHREGAMLSKIYLAMQAAAPTPNGGGDWLTKQLEAWPTRIDPERTINIEYLMKAAAKRIAALEAVRAGDGR